MIYRYRRLSGFWTTYQRQGLPFVKAAYMKGLEFYYFLCNLPTMIEETPTDVISALKSVRQKLVYAEDSVVMFAGNAQGIKIFKEEIWKLTDCLKNDIFQPADYSAIPEPADSEGIIIGSMVQYNFMFASFKKLGMKYCGKFIPLASLITSEYLVPQIRQIIGAYGAKMVVDCRGIFIFSFRDPAVDKTYCIYEGIADYILDAAFTQDDIDGHIINSFSTMAKSEGILNRAFLAMQDKYLGYPDDYRLNLLREIKSATVEDLQALSPFFRKLMESGVCSTVGGQAGIKESERKFKKIFYV